MDIGVLLHHAVHGEQANPMLQGSLADAHMTMRRRLLAALVTATQPAGNSGNVHSLTSHAASAPLPLRMVTTQV